MLAAGDGEGGLDEEIGVAVEFEDEDDEDEDEELQEVVVSDRCADVAVLAGCCCSEGAANACRTAAAVGPCC